MAVIKDNLVRFLEFVTERENIRLKREERLPPPWTADPILSMFRFCNVRREHDKVTLWIAKNWRAQFAKDPDLWFAMAVARLFNLPETLEAITSFVLPYRPKEMSAMLHQRKRMGHKLFGPAYIVSTNGLSMDKVDYLCDKVFARMWRERLVYRPAAGDTLHYAHQKLMLAPGLGSFMAAQVIADVKNAKAGPLLKARDWWDWCAPGPGSLRGLNRLLGNGPVRTGLNDLRFREQVKALRDAIAVDSGMRLCAQDVQNCLCEFDKYERARLGEGTPKQKFQYGAQGALL